MICKKCKRELPENAIFCCWCGVRQIEDAKEIKVPKPRQLPSGTWFAQVTVDGKRVPVSADTEMEYYTKARATKRGMVESEPSGGKISLEKCIEQYISSRESVLSPTTINGYRSTAKGHFEAYKKKSIKSINWQRMVNEEAKVCSAKTLKNAWGLVNSAIKECGITATVALPIVPKAERPWLTPDEIPAFLAAIRGKPGELPALLALHSLRRGEVMGLKWEDINNGVIHVRHVMIRSEDGSKEKPTPKTVSSDRYVKVIIPRLAELLEGGGEGFVVNENIETPRAQINAACAAAGLPEVGMHGLRHTFASLCHRLQVPIKEVMRQGGWSDYSTVEKIYTHLDEKDALNASSLMESFYLQITNEN